MQKMKKGVAVALAATMVLGSTVTAFAADTNSGSTTGSGTSEGHVEKKATKVVLPVENTDYESTTFAYIMDPERLISGTSGGKYEADATFPATASDTGVYFLTAAKTYANASKELKVRNESSHDINLTVTAEATSAATDIPLVAKDAIATATDASLYLGLAVGSDAGVAISKDTAASKTVTVPGKPGNFKVAVKADKSGYEYRALTLDEYKALDAGNASATELPWESEKFKLEGSVTKDKEITDATTAPTVDVTWSWVDPTAAPADAAPSIAESEKTKTLAADTAITIPVNVGSGSLAATEVTSVNPKHVANYDMISKGLASYSNGTITIPASTINTMIAKPSTYLPGGKCVLVITFDDSDGTSVEVTLNAPAE